MGACLPGINCGYGVTYLIWNSLPCVSSLDISIFALFKQITRFVPFPADSSDNSDLEDDIILSLNEWGVATHRMLAAGNLPSQKQGDQITGGDTEHPSQILILGRTSKELQPFSSCSGQMQVPGTFRAFWQRDQWIGLYFLRLLLFWFFRQRHDSPLCGDLWRYFTIYFLCIKFFPKEQNSFIWNKQKLLKKRGRCHKGSMLVSF